MLGAAGARVTIAVGRVEAGKQSASLAPLLKATMHSRLIALPLLRIKFRNGQYAPMVAYGCPWAANALLALAVHGGQAHSGVIALAVLPGLVFATGLGRRMAWRYFQHLGV